jgi:malate dehydrogenase
VTSVTNLAVWGNHSSTQFPDFENARIDGRPAADVVDDPRWLQGEFIVTVQQRGAKIIEARGLSSAASAANAVVDSVRSIREPTPEGDCVSLAVVSHGEYDTPAGLVFGLPVRSDGSGWEVVGGFEHSPFARERVRVTTEELESERDAVRDLLG